MGKGKAKRRRQSNYEAAHSSGSTLAPPPNSKDLNALPNKLKTIINFMHSAPQGGKQAGSKQNDSKEAKQKRAEPTKNGTLDENAENQDALESKSRKRKRNDALEQFAETLKAQGSGKKTRERRKNYLKEKKEKKKKTSKLDNDPSLKQLYKREEVKFGEVVDAPPKLPKLKKNKAGIGASQERLRLQAVEAYREKRGWASRPGVTIPVGNPI